MERKTDITGNLFWEDEDDDEPVDLVPESRQKIQIPAYVMEILETETSRFRKMTHEKLIRRLDAWPYQAPIGSQSLGRILNGLAMNFPEVVVTKDGVYYDAERCA